MKTFFKQCTESGWPDVMFLERSFVLKIGGYALRGQIDRIDKLGNGEVEIIDYKTGNPKDKLDADDKRQLLLYHIAAEEVFGLKPTQLTYYYLDNGTSLSFSAKDKDIEKLKEEILGQIKAIHGSDFSPKPGFLCSYCDFNEICEFRK